MNYTLIIILIVLLFVIYQLKASEKKEGFNVPPLSPTACPSGFVEEGDKCIKMTYKNGTYNCPSGSIRVAGSNNSISKFAHCKTTVPKECASGTVKVDNGNSCCPQMFPKFEKNASVWNIPPIKRCIA